MPYRRQPDYPGAWFHVFNRSIAKRPLFERRDDFRRFFDLVAEARADGLVEVHAASLLTTHMHLLERSPTGETSRGMQQIELGYARSFNRSRRRDGPLFRGRFRSKLIESSVYWENVLRYIDLNPVQAGLARVPSDYAFGSASVYRWGGDAPWLVRSEVEAVICDFSGRPEFRGEDYERFVGLADPRVVRELAYRRGRRGRRRRQGPDECDNLVHAAPSHIRAWMDYKARLADGTPAGLVLVSPGTIMDLVSALELGDASRTVLLGQRPASAWAILRAGLLHQTCGLKLSEIGALLACSTSTAHRRQRQHFEALRASVAYGDLAAEVVHRAVQRDIPVPTSALSLPLRTPFHLATAEERRETAIW